MVLSLITPGFAAAESPSGKLHQSVNETQATAKEKMGKRLLGEFEKQEKTTFLVKFKESSDSAKVAKEARTKAQKKKLSAHDAKYQQRSAVVSDLKSVSIESKQAVVEYLESEMANVNVDEFNTYFIDN
jgi:bacillopeptidase F